VARILTLTTDCVIRWVKLLSWRQVVLSAVKITYLSEIEEKSLTLVVYILIIVVGARTRWS